MIILKSPNGEINYFMLLIFLMVCLGQAGIIEKMLSAASDWSDKQGTESCQQKKEKHPTYAVAIPQEKIVYVPMAPKKSSPKAQVVKAQVVQAKVVKAAPAPAPAKMGQVVQAKVIKAESPSMVKMGKATSGKMAMGQPWESGGGAEMMEMGNPWADASEQQYQQQQQQQQSDYNYEDDYVQDERMQESSSDNQQQSFEEVLDNEEIDYSFSPSDSMQSPSRSLANILHVGPNGRYKISSMTTSDVDTEWN